MKVTREGVFETNSSSTHSISIKGGDYAPSAFPLIGGVCQVHPGEFGWNVDNFTTPGMKASYCLTYVKTCCDPHGTNAKMLRDVLKVETGCEVEFMSKPKRADYDYEWGYIDHQSDDVCGPAFDSPEMLRDFIFNPKSVLRTDNDNH